MFDLGGMELILSIPRLETPGKVEVYWQELTMAFQHGGKLVRIKGDPPCLPWWVFGTDKGCREENHWGEICKGCFRGGTKWAAVARLITVGVFRPPRVTSSKEQWSLYPNQKWHKPSQCVSLPICALIEERNWNTYFRDTRSRDYSPTFMSLFQPWLYWSRKKKAGVGDSVLTTRHWTTLPFPTNT